MSTLSVDTIQGQTTAANVKLPAGAIVQTLQFTTSEQTISAGSGTTIINGTFNPKFSGSKFIVSAFIPNCTATSGGSLLLCMVALEQTLLPIPIL